MKTLLIALIVLISSCGLPSKDPSTGGQTGEESAGCLPVSETELSLDEEAESGQSAQSIFDQISDRGPYPINWQTDDTTSTISLEVSNPRDAKFVDLELRSDNNIEIATDCLDPLQLTVDLEFRTEDGRLEMNQTALVSATSDGAISTIVPFEDDKNDGTFALPPGILASYIEISWSTDGGQFFGTREESFGDLVGAVTDVFASW